MRKIIIFEPWGLGDLAIATNSALNLIQQYRISFICSPQWVEWLKSLDFVDEVVSYQAPWTEKRGKYNPLKYKVCDILSVKSEIKRIQPEFIWDPRGDIRHYIFLKALSEKPVVSLRYPKNLNVYQRVNLLINYLELKPINQFNHSGIKESSKYVAVFFGAYWENRQVPFKKSKEIVLALLEMGLNIKLILQPADDEFLWYNLKAQNNLQIIKTDIESCSKIISESRIVISTDSAWLHIAHYYGVPTIGLFGSFNAEQWAPLDCKVIYASNPLPANLRYKFKYENVQPLADISILKICGLVKPYFFY